MKHSGKPFKAAMRIIFWTLVLLAALFAAGVLATRLGSVVAMVSTTSERDERPGAPSTA